MSLTAALRNCTGMVLRGDWRMVVYYARNKLAGLDFRFADQHDLGLQEDRANWYADSGGPKLLRIAKTLPIRCSDRALDLGCGKGGAMITLARMPFERVDGVEISEALVLAARRNIRRCKVSNSVIFNCDAAAFRNYDTYTFIYMFNPFPAAVMRAVARNLAESLERAPRRLTLLYKNPVDRAMFEEMGFLPVREFRNDENPTVAFVREPYASLSRSPLFQTDSAE